MSLKIATYSVCCQFLLRRKDIVSFIHRTIPGVRVLSIDLDDHIFTMTISMRGEKFQQIQEAILEKQLHVSLIKVEEDTTDHDIFFIF